MHRFCSLFMAAFVGASLLVGCAESAKTAKVEKKSPEKKEEHTGWWCQEHGVPEDLCSLCSADVAAKCKKEGDWCKIHDRAQSQCFKCDPKKYEKFEAMHVAKYNKKPERPADEEFQK